MIDKDTILLGGVNPCPSRKAKHCTVLVFMIINFDLGAKSWDDNRSLQTI